MGHGGLFHTMSKDPAILFYTSDFLTGTILMSHEQVGIYIRLLCVLHQHGGSIDKEAFDSFIGNHDILRSKFIIEDGIVLHKRLTEEMEKRAKKSSSMSENAKIKWEKFRSSSDIRRDRLLKAREIGTHTKEQWDEVKNFFKFCVRCGKDCVLQKDHIIPIYKGGSDSITNIQPLCLECSSSKEPESIDFRIIFCDKNKICMPMHLHSKSIANAMPIEDENEINTTIPNKVFKKPSLEEVKAYCIERNNKVDFRGFIDHYEANGWIRGKTRIKDWKACVRTWEAKAGFKAKEGPLEAYKPDPKQQELVSKLIKETMKTIGR